MASQTSLQRMQNMNSPIVGNGRMLSALLLASLLVAAGTSGAQPPARTTAPLLGWNSYDCYGSHINEKLARENLEAFVHRLKPHGYEYFVIDAGWYRHYDLKAGESWPTDGDHAHLAIDAFGRFTPSPVQFPTGFKALVEFAHTHGVKFGLHLMRGIPRKAVELDLPIKGTPYSARDIANVNDVCSWSVLNYGIDMDKPGAQEYYNSVAELVASWGIDFIKYDDIVHKPREINAVADAIARTGRRIILSISPGDDIDPAHFETYQRADMIRISRDIWDLREDIEISFSQWDKLRPYAGKGFWLDMDMIPFGHLRVNYPVTRNRLNSTRGYERMDSFTYAQKKSFITQRAMAASPVHGRDPDLFRYDIIRAHHRQGHAGVQSKRGHRQPGKESLQLLGESGHLEDTAQVLGQRRVDWCLQPQSVYGDHQVREERPGPEPGDDLFSLRYLGQKDHCGHGTIHLRDTGR